MPVDRKLVYIDPSPELSAQWAQDGHAINPVENVAAAFSLARYETIRLTPSRRYGSLTVVRVHQYKISLSKVARCANGGRYPAAGVCGGAYLRAYISRVDLRSIGVWT